MSLAQDYHRLPSDACAAPSLLRQSFLHKRQPPSNWALHRTNKKRFLKGGLHHITLFAAWGSCRYCDMMATRHAMHPTKMGYKPCKSNLSLFHSISFSMQSTTCYCALFVFVGHICTRLGGQLFKLRRNMAQLAWNNVRQIYWPSGRL